MVCVWVTLQHITVFFTFIADKRGGRYASPIDAVWKTFRSEGIFGLYKGFLAFYVRITPHTIVTFVLFEELRRITSINPI